MTLNDSAGHLPTSPHTFINFPVLTSATSSASEVTVTGTYRFISGTYTLHFYANSGYDTDPLTGLVGYGEGELYLGSTVVTANATGEVIGADGRPGFSVTFANYDPDYPFITATAFRAGSGTSEFSHAVEVDRAPDPTADAVVNLALSGDPSTWFEHQNTTHFDATGSTAPAGESISYYFWDFGDGTWATGPTASHTYPDGGHYTATLTIYTPFGGTATVPVTIANTAPSAAGLFNTGPEVLKSQPVAVGFVGAFDPSPADRAALRYGYALRTEDLATTYATATDPPEKEFTFTNSGTHLVYGRVFDPDGAFDPAPTAVTVVNRAPRSGSPERAGAPVPRSVGHEFLRGRGRARQLGR